MTEEKQDCERCQAYNWNYQKLLKENEELKRRISILEETIKG